MVGTQCPTKSAARLRPASWRASEIPDRPNPQATMICRKSTWLVYGASAKTRDMEYWGYIAREVRHAPMVPLRPLSADERRAVEDARPLTHRRGPRVERAGNIAALAGGMKVAGRPTCCCSALSHPRWEFVFQPKYAAYLNLIEPWWKVLRSLALKGRRFDDVGGGRAGRSRRRRGTGTGTGTRSSGAGGGAIGRRAAGDRPPSPASGDLPDVATMGTRFPW